MIICDHDRYLVLGFVWCVGTTHMFFDLESDFLFLRQAVVPAVQPLRPGPVQAESRNSAEFLSRCTTPACDGFENDDREKIQSLIWT